MGAQPSQVAFRSLAQARLTARWLAQGRVLQGWSLLLAALGLAVLVFLPPAHGPRGAWALLVLAPGLLAALACVRIGLDAALFDDLAEGRLQLTDLDAALASVRRVAPGPTRDMAARCRGAQTWWWRGVACVAAQAVLLPVLLCLSFPGA